MKTEFRLGEMYERIITKKVSKKAKEMGIEFKVKHSKKDGLDDILLRIKRNEVILNKDSSEEEVAAYEKKRKQQNEFAEYVSNIVIGQYANQIRFSYPSRL